MRIPWHSDSDHSDITMARDGTAGWVAILPPRWRASIDRPLALAIQVGALRCSAPHKWWLKQSSMLPAGHIAPSGRRRPHGTQIPHGFIQWGEPAADCRCHDLVMGVDDMRRGHMLLAACMWAVPVVRHCLPDTARWLAQVLRHWLPDTARWPA